MRTDNRSYSTISKTGPKLDGKFDIAFGEFPKLSSFTLIYDDGAKYEFGSTGSIRRNRRNGMGDQRSEDEIAREAAKLIKDNTFVSKTVKAFNEKKYNISAKDINSFGHVIESRHSVRVSDNLTSKLMGGN